MTGSAGCLLEFWLCLTEILSEMPAGIPLLLRLAAGVVLVLCPPPLAPQTQRPNTSWSKTSGVFSSLPTLVFHFAFFMGMTP